MDMLYVDSTLTLFLVSFTIRLQVEKKPTPDDSAGAGGSGLGRKLSRKQEKAPEGQDSHDASVDAGKPSVSAAPITSSANDATAAADGEAEIGKPGPAPPENPETEVHTRPSTSGGASESASGGLMSKFKELITT